MHHSCRLCVPLVRSHVERTVRPTCVMPHEGCVKQRPLAMVYHCIRFRHACENAMLDFAKLFNARFISQGDRFMCDEERKSNIGGAEPV
jgi:hypothetical protein